jgi:hypothetical protein
MKTHKFASHWKDVNIQFPAFYTVRHGTPNLTCLSIWARHAPLFPILLLHRSPLRLICQTVLWILPFALGTLLRSTVFLQVRLAFAMFRFVGLNCGHSCRTCASVMSASLQWHRLVVSILKLECRWCHILLCPVRSRRIITCSLLELIVSITGVGFWMESFLMGYISYIEVPSLFHCSYFFFLILFNSVCSIGHHCVVFLWQWFRW